VAARAAGLCHAWAVTFLASLDGAIAPREETSIPVTDEGLLRGDGGFEVLRLYAGRPFALDEHLARLRHTCAGLRLEADLGALRREIDALLERSGDVDALLRLVVTRGGRRLAIVEPLPDHPASVRMATVTYAPTRVLNGLKTLSYAANMLAGRLAGEEGAEEALLVTPHGRVLEGPTASFFWVRDGGLRTPPLEDGILDSITRRRLLEELDVAVAPCTVDDLRAAEEAFVASTVREVMPVTAIDDIALPLAPGPVTTSARDVFVLRVARELAEEREAARAAQAA
jgi:branched-chain amino acid aminotransferase